MYPADTYENKMGYYLATTGWSKEYAVSKFGLQGGLGWERFKADEDERAESYSVIHMEDE